mgnify:FL=1
MTLDDITLTILNSLPPELAHSIGKFFMKRKIFQPGEFTNQNSRINLFGINLPNPLGITAGFDKYATLQNHVQKNGFGWIEEGSFTYHGGKGNTKPRLFRTSDGGTLNRMGLNCIPAELARERLSQAENPFSFGVSIAKTHNEKIVGDKAIEDIINSYNLLKHLGLYTVINISCPNTKEGKTFEVPESFAELHSTLTASGKNRPLLYKFSPFLDQKVLEKLVEISHDYTDGYEAVNTKPYSHPEFKKGGLSGPAIREEAKRTIKMLRKMTSKPLLGCGGISTGQDAYAMLNAGANALLVFNGYVRKHPENPYAGRLFAHEVNQELLELKVEAL